MAEQWEYKTVREVPDDEELNKLGAEGWELAGVVSNTVGSITPGLGGVGARGTTSTSVWLIFKRRKQ